MGQARTRTRAGLAQSLRIWLAVAATSALTAPLGGSAVAAAAVDVAVPDFVVDTNNYVRCSGSGCDLSIWSYQPPVWGCFEEVFGGVSVARTQCRVFVTGRIAATVVPNGPCTLTAIDRIQVNFVSGVNANVGGTWHQDATFVPVTNSAVGTTKYHVVVHGGGELENQSVGAGSMYGEFDLTFPGAGLLRSCRTATATDKGTLTPTPNAVEPRYDGSVITLTADSVR